MIKIDDGAWLYRNVTISKNAGNGGGYQINGLEGYKFMHPYTKPLATMKNWIDAELKERQQLKNAQ